MEIAWTTKKTCFVSERMALRLAAKLYSKQSGNLRVKEILQVATGKNTYHKPNWFPGKSALVRYDDMWDDWQAHEIDVLVARIRDQKVSKRLIKEALDVPDDVMKWVSEELAGVQHTVLLRSMADGDDDQFEAYTESDIADEATRKAANSLYTEYGSRVDMTRPTNRVLVRQLISLEMRLRKANAELLTAKTDRLKVLTAEIKSLQSLYTDAAEGIAQLEKQFEIRPEDESLDAVIHRSHDIRLDWRRHEQMSTKEGVELIRLVAKLHRVDLEIRGDTIPQVAIPDGEPDLERRKLTREMVQIELSERDDAEKPTMAIS